jgi:hypothetical protein
LEMFGGSRILSTGMAGVGDQTKNKIKVLYRPVYIQGRIYELADGGSDNVRRCGGFLRQKILKC